MEAAALIGRDRPAGTLQAEISRTIDSHGDLVLIAGEAGIGKTALVVAAMEEARRRDVLVLSAACWERGGAPGYWPWVQVVRNLERTALPQEWHGARAAAGDALSFLLGEASEAPRPAGSETGGFRLYDAVTTLLVTASRSRAVVVVLEDLHWADPASVKLLDFVVRHSWFERLLVVGTYRDDEVEAAGHPLAPLILPLAAHARTIELAGLDRASVGLLMARTAARAPDEELAAEVHRRTGGNPLFVEQMARLWHGGTSIAGIAPVIRDAIERRLAHLPPGVVKVLTSAAVLGTEFDPLVLAACVGESVTEVNALLRQAITARLVVSVDDRRFSFAHELVRETLYGSLDDAELRRLHAAVVRAIARSPDLRSRLVPADRANHARLAIPDVDAADALVLVIDAARDASRRLASEEAARHYGHALELVPEDAPRRRAAIALDLGVEQQRAGELEQARQTFEKVVAVAQNLNDPALLARAALGLHGLGIGRRERGNHQIDLIDEARTRLIGDDPAPGSGLALRLLAAASRARTHHTPVDPAALELSARAVDLARRSGDDEALGSSLLARHDAIWEPGTAKERAALADEMTAAARRRADRELELQASLLRMVALLEQGDPGALKEHASFVAMAERTRLPRFRFLALSRQGTIAILTGHFEQARAFIDEAFALGERLGEVDRTGVWRGQTWGLAVLQGNLDEASALVDAYHADADPWSSVVGASLAAQAGETDLACRLLADVTPVREQFPGWFASMPLIVQAEVAAATRDPQRCATARAEIAPLVDQWAVVAAGVLVHGPMAHWCALIDAAQGRWDDAIAGFTAAQRAADRLGARPWSIEARARLAEALIARGLQADAGTASGLLSDVEREAGELGMLAALERARGAQPRAARHGIVTGPVGTARAPTVFRLKGDVWTIAFAGRMVHMPDAKGLRDLHTLLGQPGIDVPVLVLLDPGRATPQAPRRLGADAILDERAKARYRQRLAELDEQIDRALDRHDDHRAAQLDNERQALIDELRRATGLAGRSRRLGDEGERARKTVTARIRDSLRRLDQRHPELARYLRATISTGITCRYQPAGDVTWRL
ncbi:MAG TPA: AAA family ATPase [Acidimicrobiales bacterium]|nr:AAA family ATPase [Acidimicrobiales bacterium]